MMREPRKGFPKGDVKKGIKINNYNTKKGNSVLTCLNKGCSPMSSWRFVQFGKEGSQPIERRIGFHFFEEIGASIDSCRGSLSANAYTQGRRLPILAETHTRR